MVGTEGMVGTQVVLGVVEAPVRALVQGAGSALRIPIKAFRAELDSCRALKQMMDRYLYVLNSQLTTSLSCVRFHQVAPRLARWLLMSHDRAHSDEFSVGAVIVLALMLAGFVFYMAFDAMRVSQAKSTGASINDPLNDFSKNLPIGPIILIGIGALLLLNNFRIFDFLHLSLGRLWPLFLIGAGVLMFRNRIGRS